MSGSLNMAEYSLHELKVSYSWGLHKLANKVDIEKDIGFSKC